MTVAPLARFASGIAEIPGNGIFMTCGRTSSTVLSDTIRWDGSSWTSIIGGDPGPRFDHIMSYDGSCLMLNGGSDGIRHLSGTWVFGGTNWIQQNIPATNPYTAPTTLRAAVSARQSGLNEVVVFGGNASYQRHYVSDTWVWTAGAPGIWMQLQPPAVPSGREYAAFGSSATTGVMFGGKNFDGPLSDFWHWNGTTWAQLAAVNEGPSARYGAKIVYDSTQTKFILFGGITKDGFSNETWTFNFGSLTWANVSPATSPGGRAHHALCYDSTNSNTVLFGGLGADRVFGDTWILSSSNLWSQQ